MQLQMPPIGLDSGLLGTCWCLLMALSFRLSSLRDMIPAVMACSRDAISMIIGSIDLRPAKGVVCAIQGYYFFNTAAQPDFFIDHRTFLLFP